MVYQYIAFLILLFISRSTCGFNKDIYKNSYVLNPLDYTVYWNVDLAANELHLALKVKTTGWVGFGIAEPSSGSMPGADIMIGYVDSNGKGYISDRWSHDFVEPTVDDCQGVTLVSAEETDGYTILEVTRPLNVTDAQDRSIAFGPNRIVAAFGTSDTLGFHASNRKTDEITFYGHALWSGAVVEGELTMEFRMDNYVVPDTETIYACQAFAVPVDQDYTITRIDPLVDSANVAHVHHFLTHVCVNQSTKGIPLVTRYFNNPGQCSSPLGNLAAGCTGLLQAWAVGGGSTYTPPDVGFSMGAKSTSIKYLILEVHYNNPGAKGGYRDTSGIRIHYSTTPRKFEAEVLALGDPFVNFPDIAANSIVEYESECLAECTSKFPHDIMVFNSFPHMHQVGSKMWTTQWRQGKMIDQIGRIEFWAFNNQLQQQLNITIKKGDRLNTHCVYDTRGKSSPVPFGDATTEEMCIHFISYYPRMYKTVSGGALAPYGFCGYFHGQTGCGAADANSDSLVFIKNPSNLDPPANANRTFGVGGAVCPVKESSASHPSSVFAFLLSFIVFIFVSC